MRGGRRLLTCLARVSLNGVSSAAKNWNATMGVRTAVLLALASGGCGGRVSGGATPCHHRSGGSVDGGAVGAACSDESACSSSLACRKRHVPERCVQRDGAALRGWLPPLRERVLIHRRLHDRVAQRERAP